jgi:hypothetical protein
MRRLLLALQSAHQLLVDLLANLRIMDATDFVVALALLLDTLANVHALCSISLSP